MTSVTYQCTSVSLFWFATSSNYTTVLRISWFLAYAQYAPHPPHTLTHHEILFKIQKFVASYWKSVIFFYYKILYVCFFHITQLLWVCASALQLVVHGQSSSGTQRIIEIVLIIRNVKKNIYKRCAKILFPVVEYKYRISSVIRSQLTTKYCNMFKDVKKACQTKGTEDPRIFDVLCLRAANPSMHLHVCAHAPQCWNSHLTIFKCLTWKIDYSDLPHDAGKTERTPKSSWGTCQVMGSLNG